MQIGQQGSYDHPLPEHSAESRNSLARLPTDLFLVDRLEHFCAHVAITFVSDSDDVSLFWDLEKTAEWTTGRPKTRYPLMGLMEIGNVTVENPRNDDIESCISDPWGRLTYVQHYSPFVKGLSESMLKNHPFLLTYLLGYDFVRSNKHFATIANSAIELYDIRCLKECVNTSIHSGARFEFVVQCDSADVLNTLDMRRLAESIVTKQLLVKVPTEDIKSYAINLIDELAHPLVRAVYGTIEGPSVLGTVLFCESVLAILPSFSFKESSYSVFKAYSLVPLLSGSMSEYNRICMVDYGDIDDECFVISTPLIERIFVPLKNLPRTAVLTATKMVRFLDSLRGFAHQARACDKAAEIVITQFVQDLRLAAIIPGVSATKTLRSTDSVTGVETVASYMEKVFTVDRLATNFSSRSFLMVSVQLFGESRMAAALEKHLLAKVKFLPSVSFHAGILNFKTAEYIVLTKSSPATSSSHDDVERVLNASKSIINDHFHFTRSQLNKLTKPTPRLVRTLTSIFRTTHMNARIMLGITVVTVILIGEDTGVIGKVSLRDYYRSVHLSRSISMAAIKRHIEVHKNSV